MSVLKTKEEESNNKIILLEKNIIDLKEGMKQLDEKLSLSLLIKNLGV